MRKLLLFLILLLLPALFACSQGDMTVTIPKIGAADCIIIDAGGHAVMIDTGEDDDAEEIQKCLATAGIRKLDCLIVTHFDKDHIGSAAAILESVPVARVIMPDYACKTKPYKRMTAAIDAKGVPCDRLTGDIEFTAGDMLFSVRAPKKAEYADGDNDHSLVIYLTYGAKRFCFAGDAEAERLSELLTDGDLAVDVLKAPHHGRFNENSEAFLDASSPKYVVMTDSDKSPADADYLALLLARGAEAYETRAGDVHITTNGKYIAVHQDD